MGSKNRRHSALALGLCVWVGCGVYDATDAEFVQEGQPQVVAEADMPAKVVCAQGWTEVEMRNGGAAAILFRMYFSIATDAQGVTTAWREVRMPEIPANQGKGVTDVWGNGTKMGTFHYSLAPGQHLGWLRRGTGAIAYVVENANGQVVTAGVNIGCNNTTKVVTLAAK